MANRTWMHSKLHTRSGQAIPKKSAPSGQTESYIPLQTDSRRKNVRANRRQRKQKIRSQHSRHDPRRLLCHSHPRDVHQYGTIKMIPGSQSCQSNLGETQRRGGDIRESYDLGRIRRETQTRLPPTRPETSNAGDATKKATTRKNAEQKSHTANSANPQDMYPKLARKKRTGRTVRKSQITRIKPGK